ncbi:MAG: SPFH domain-containing protein [Patescibacteria group bacterium]
MPFSTIWLNRYKTVDLRYRQLSQKLEATTIDGISVTVSVALTYRVNRDPENLKRLAYGRLNETEHIKTRLSSTWRNIVIEQSFDTVQLQHKLLGRQLSWHFSEAMAGFGYRVDYLEITEVNIPARIRESIEEVKIVDYESSAQSKRLVHKLKLKKTEAEASIDLAWLEGKAEASKLDARLNAKVRERLEFGRADAKVIGLKEQAQLLARAELVERLHQVGIPADRIDKTITALSLSEAKQLSVKVSETSSESDVSFNGEVKIGAPT